MKRLLLNTKYTSQQIKFLLKIEQAQSTIPNFDETQIIKDILPHHPLPPFPLKISSFLPSSLFEDISHPRRNAYIQDQARKLFSFFFATEAAARLMEIRVRPGGNGRWTCMRKTRGPGASD